MAVETVAVIGSGLMGRGIAYVAAVGGFRTIVHDVSAPALDRAFAHIRKDLDDGVSRGKLTAADATAATYAIPRPIRPEPMTATVSTVTGGSYNARPRRER